MDHQQSGRKQTANSPEVAMASEVFDQFCNATTLKSILGYYRQLCELLKIRPNTINQFYPKLKAKLRSWKAQALWKKFDQRANHKCYNRGKACPNTRVLIIGGGPCGLRSAIEAQLLGAKVVVVEKRDRMSRNNVLHLWPFVIHDLRGLGAKKFFGKFCAGSIDHISIRQLQCILLKVALILGVEFHESVSFDSLIPPPENQEEGKIGWRAKTTPADHPVSQYEFDVLIGADGKRNTLEGFKRKEFRGKLAIAITANFINKRTEAEARVEEISGVAFIFNQKFFKELYHETGIDLENIVYYKDDTHYFVMTAKKHSLIDKGVILQDHADTAKLLAKENVDREALMLYAREAAEFSTEYQMMDMEFAVNHYGQPDVAMFDFTSMYAAENASRVMERHGHRLLMILVGDSLLEPFWPTGSGCARGFLSSLDACWAIKGWGASLSPLEVIAERESIYRLLGQTTPENLNRDYAAYTLDPHTRYPNLNVSSVTPIQVRSLLDTDDPDSIKQPPVLSEVDIPKKRRRRDLRGDTQVHPDTLLRWLQKQVALYDNIHIEDMGASFKDGLAICAIIHRYRPDLIDFHSLQPDDITTNNQLAFDILEKELGIPPIMTGEEMAQCDVPDKLAMFSYLTQIYEVFRGEIPHVKHPKLEPEKEPDQKAQLIGRFVRPDSATRTRRSRHNDNVHPMDKKGDTISRRSRKRRSTEKMGTTVEERQKRLAEIEKNRADRMKRRQYLRKMATQQFYKSMQMLQANAKREKDEPFEDYSIFLYRQTAPDFKDRVKDLEQKILYPDREPKIHAGHRRSNIDEEFSGRIKNIEDKLKGSAPSEKKPRDLLRAIGKIEKTDWNVKEIEKKIEENKMGRAVRHDKVERVPKWSREQFLARQIKMEKKGRDQKETDSKYADIDNTLKNIDRKIKEGNVLGYNKVSAMAEQFSNKSQDTEPKVQKSNAKATIALPAQGGSEICHFCNKRVYLMERLSAEGKFFHRGCFRCEYCSTSLRIGNHTFDREKNGGRFYCTQHFGFSGTMKARAEKKRITALNKENIPNAAVNLKTPEKSKIPLEGVVGLDLLDRGQTPERIEFENLAGMSDAEEAQSQMDEDEWTDRNFGASTAEMGSSDDISDMSDSDDDNEVYEEAIDQPLTTEGTLELAKNWTLRYSHPHAATGQSDTGSNEYEDSSDEYTSEDDESGTATEDEDDIRARELRKQEVWLKHPTRSSDTDTGSETEVKISQDSLDKISEESHVPSVSDSEQSPNLTSSPERNVNNSDTPIDENVVDIKDVQSSQNVEISNSHLVATDRDKSIENVANSKLTILDSQNEANGSVIQVPCQTLDANNAQNVIANVGSVAPCDHFFVEDSLNTENIKKEYKPDFQSTSDKPTALSFEESKDICDNSIVKSAEINTINDELGHAILTDLNVETSKLIIETSIKDQIDGKGIMLPDAIPCNDNKSTDTLLPSDKGILNIDEKLPDLVASSPKHSRHSSPSLSDVYQSTETLYNESLAEDLFYESSVESLDDYQAKDTHQHETAESSFSEETASKDRHKLKLCVNLPEKMTCPLVTITSPSPTSERPIEETTVEVTKLTVPKQTLKQPVESNIDSSFDKLKRDLKQRKAKNKIKEGELRPLSIENAQRKISKYFVEKKRTSAKSDQGAQKEDKRNEDEDAVNIVELQIKPKISDKVDAKDIMKYFDKARPRSPEGKPGIKTDNLLPENQSNLDISIDDLDAIDDYDIDVINQQFDQIGLLSENVKISNEKTNKALLDLNTLPINAQLSNKDNEIEAKSISAANNNDTLNQNNKESLNTSDSAHKILINLRNEENIGARCNNVENELREKESLREVNEVPIMLGNNVAVDTKSTTTTLQLEKLITTDTKATNILHTIDNNVENKLHEQKGMREVNNLPDKSVVTDAKSQLPTLQLERLKITGAKGTNILHASDSNLNIKQQINRDPDMFGKTSKSSSELRIPVESVPVAKVKVIEQKIEAPMRVSKVNVENTFDSSSSLSEPPKRPERRHSSHESNSPIKLQTPDMQSTPEVPVRKKTNKKMSNVALTSEEVIPQSNSVTNIERLPLTDTNSDTRINSNNTSDKAKMPIKDKLSSTVKCTDSTESKQSQSINRLLSSKSDLRGSTKSITSKSDRSKKDKCVVS